MSRLRQKTPNSISAGAPPQTRLAELRALHGFLTVFTDQGKGRERKDREKEKEGKDRKGEGRRRGALPKLATLDPTVEGDGEGET